MTTTETNEYQARVNAATNLRHLCGILNAIEDELSDPDCMPRLEDVVDICGLPTFGGKEPSETSNIWSWDADELLSYETDFNRGYYTFPRDDTDDEQ